MEGLGNLITTCMELLGIWPLRKMVTCHISPLACASWSHMGAWQLSQHVRLMMICHQHVRILLVHGSQGTICVAVGINFNWSHGRFFEQKCMSYQCLRLVNKEVVKIIYDNLNSQLYDEVSWEFQSRVQHHSLMPRFSTMNWQVSIETRCHRTGSWSAWHWSIWGQGWLWAPSKFTSELSMTWCISMLAVPYQNQEVVWLWWLLVCMEYILGKVLFLRVLCFDTSCLLSGASFYHSGPTIVSQAWALRRMTSVYNAMTRRPHVPRDRSLRLLMHDQGLNVEVDPAPAISTLSTDAPIADGNPDGDDDDDGDSSDSDSVPSTLAESGESDSEFDMDQLDEDAPPGLLSEVLYQQVILNNNTRTWLYTQLGYCWESVDILCMLLGNE